MSEKRMKTGMLRIVALAISSSAVLVAQAPPARPPVIMGPNVGPSPYTVVRGWHKPFARAGFTFGGSSGVFAESPDRIFIAQRGEFRLPQPVPPEFAGYAGSIGVNVLNATAGRTWQHCLYVLDGDGNLRENWHQWDHLCAGSPGPGPHRLRISPYDPERRVWVVNETFHTIYVFSNDGAQLLMTLGEKNVPGNDRTHFARPQDVAFLPDGRVIVADGLDNHRVIVLDRNGRYITEVGGQGTAPGQFNGVHAVAVGPGNLVYALDRSGGRINVFRYSSDPSFMQHVDTWPGFSLPLDLIVNDDSLWLTDLNPLRFIKMDFKGNRLYTWLVPRELPDGYLEVHTFSVDSNLNLYGGDNQYGRTQKFVPRRDADPALIIRPPWRAR